MKKFILFIVVFTVILSLSFSQTEENARFGLSRALTITPDGDLGSEQVLSDILDVYNLAPSSLTPTLLKDYGRYSIRRVRYGKYEEYYNKKLVALIDIFNQNVSQLSDPEGIIREIRVILNDTNDMYIKGKLIAFYGNLLEINPPTQADSSGYSPSKLFILDSLSAVVSSGAHSYRDVQATYLLSVFLPYFRNALEKDPSLTNNQYIQSRTYYLLRYFTNTKKAQESVISLIKDFLRIEDQQAAR